MGVVPMLHLNVGCGMRPLRGYVNLDTQQYTGVDYSQVEFWTCDIRQGIPCANEAACEVRADQFLEHLSLAEEVQFLREAWRVLCIGGELRLSFPDIAAMAEECAAGRQDFVADRDKLVMDGVPKGLSVLNHIAYGGWGHKAILTVELVRMMIAAMGFHVQWTARVSTNGLILARRNH